MNIYQIVPVLSWGDAIGNEVLAMDKLIKQIGHCTKIYADSTNLKGIDVSSVKSINVESKDTVIFHVSIGTYIDEIFVGLKCKKIVVYHNMTPSIFFEKFNKKLAKSLQVGRNDMKRICDGCELVLADSEYNRNELISMGCNGEKIKVLPIIIDFSEYEADYDEAISAKYSDGYVNILFTGRIAPNKKHEDLIRSFYYYKKNCNQKARLILAGSFDGMEKYYAKLRGYVKELKLKDVIFTGHIPFKQLLAYYRIANVFLCMSEHEGFCVPLLEAMNFEIPIIAFNSSAIPYTLGNSGILVDKKDFKVISSTIEEVTMNRDFRETITLQQRNNLNLYGYESTTKKFLNYLDEYLSNI